MAGLDDLPYEDLSRDPVWLPSEALEYPWSDQNPSPLLAIPGGLNQQALFRKDPFHVFKQTVGGHWVASGIIVLVDMGYFCIAGESAQADVLLQNAYRDFAWFVKHEWHGQYVANIKSFTKAILHWHKIKSYPYARLKGADTMLLTRWLAVLIQRGLYRAKSNQRQGVSLIDRPLEDWHVPLLKRILRGSLAGVDFFRILHSRGVWLDREKDAKPLAELCFDFVECYRDLATLCFERGLRRYMLEPSIHYYHHFAVDLSIRIRHGDKRILSPNQDNCEMDEDFVGAISRLTRNVHAATTTLRTLERYRIKAFFQFTHQDWGARERRPSKKRLRIRP